MLQNLPFCNKNVIKKVEKSLVFSKENVYNNTRSKIRSENYEK